MEKKEVKYKKVYREAWESNPVLSQWISPIPGETDKAFCRFCKTSLRAHLRDLIRHASSKKHKKYEASKDTLTTSVGGKTTRADSNYDPAGPNLHLILSSLANAVVSRTQEYAETGETTSKENEEEAASVEVGEENRETPQGNTVIVGPELLERLQEVRRKKSEMVLKIRHAGALDRDFYEAYLSSDHLTYNCLVQMCSTELGIPVSDIVKIRKLPNTTVRSDRNVQHLRHCDELEVVT